MGVLVNASHMIIDPKFFVTKLGATGKCAVKFFPFVRNTIMLGESSSGLVTQIALFAGEWLHPCTLKEFRFVYPSVWIIVVVGRRWKLIVISFAISLPLLITIGI